MSNCKYGERNVISTLLANCTFIKFTIFNTEKEDIIGWFKVISPVIYTQRTVFLQISNTLILVYMIEQEME